VAERFAHAVAEVLSVPALLVCERCAVRLGAAEPEEPGR